MRIGPGGACAAALAVALLATGARAEDATSSDLRCVIALAAAAQSADDQVKPAMIAGVIYFLGKLDGRTPQLDLGARADAERKTMSVKDFNDEIARCGAALVARTKAVAEIGQKLRQQMEPAPDAPAQPTPPPK
jgi:hypothetical protein